MVLQGQVELQVQVEQVVHQVQVEQVGWKETLLFGDLQEILILVKILVQHIFLWIVVMISVLQQRQLQ
jgi:hypothetical protein